MRIESLGVILEMALVTYATRAGGLWLMGRVHPSPRVEAWLRYVPGAVLAAIIAPIAFSGGVKETLALLVTAIVAARGGNMLLAIVTGVGSVWVLRTFL
jgi:branched chain amino acid efflux pump